MLFTPQTSETEELLQIFKIVQSLTGACCLRVCQKTLMIHIILSAILMFLVLSAILMFQYFVFVILGFFLRVSYVFLCSVTGLQVLENLLSKKKNLLFNILLILKLQ